MRKAGKMIYPKQGRKSDKCKCAKCGKELVPETAYYYVDNCNYAITNNSPLSFVKSYPAAVLQGMLCCDIWTLRFRGIT